MTITHTPIRDRLPRFVLAALGGLILLLGLMPALAHAQTFKVTRTDDPAPGACAPGDCSLREAVIAANVPGGPTRSRLPADNYRLSIPGAGSGRPGRPRPAHDVTISGAGGLAIIDGNGLITGDRVFEVSAGAQVQMKRLRVAFGRPDRRGQCLARRRHPGQLRVQPAVLEGIRPPQPDRPRALSGTAAASTTRATSRDPLDRARQRGVGALLRRRHRHPAGGSADARRLDRPQQRRHVRWRPLR